MNILKMVLIVGPMVFGVASKAQGQAIGGVALGPPTDNQITTFRETTNGDWETTVVRPDGTSFVYTYIPATKIAPEIAVRLTRVPGQALFVYQYELTNGPTARQEFAVVWFNIANPVAVKGLADGWVNEARPGGGLLSWRGPLVGEAPSGLAPGTTQSGMTVESPVLPGVGEARCRGNTLGAVVVPSGLSERQDKELYKLSEKSAMVTIPIVAPLIGAGVGEPELSLSVLLARIGLNYVSAFQSYRHPDAAALSEAFDAVYNSAKEDLKDSTLQKSLATVLEISQRSVKSRWHQQMSEGLAFCIRAVQEGIVPNRRMVSPQDFDDR